MAVLQKQSNPSQIKDKTNQSYHASLNKDIDTLFQAAKDGGGGSSTLSGVIVETIVEYAPYNTFLVYHNLGYAPENYVVVSQDQNANIWFGDQSDVNSSIVIRLAFKVVPEIPWSANMNVKTWVW